MFHVNKAIFVLFKLSHFGKGKPVYNCIFNKPYYLFNEKVYISKIQKKLHLWVDDEKQIVIIYEFLYRQRMYMN